MRKKVRGFIAAIMALGVMFACAGFMTAGWNTASAAKIADMSGVIQDQKLYQVLQILANYKAANGTSFYQDVNGSYSKDITTMAEAQQYKNSALSQENLEAYDDEVNLAPYGSISSLSGINYATGVKKLVLPKKLGSTTFTSIEAMTCKGMSGDASGLQTVVMPETVTSIGESAFENCTKLKTIRTYKDSYNESYNAQGAAEGLDLSKVKVIGKSAFAHCSAAVDLTLLSNTSGQNITIRANAFECCASLKHVSVPKGSLGTAVFKGCSGLETISFDDSYRVIPESTLAGAGSEGGIDISFPANLETIDSYAFDGCVIAGGTDFSECDDLSEIKDLAFVHAAFSGSGSVVLPDDMTQMGTAAFAMTTGLKSVKLPVDLERIPDGAFLYSYDLADISSNGNTDITEIGKHAFDMCGNLEDLSFFNDDCPQLYSIGEYAFARCVPKCKDTKAEGLQEIVINDSVEELGAYAFKDDFTVQTADFGEGVTDIPEGLIACGRNNFMTSRGLDLMDISFETESGDTIQFDFLSSDEFSGIRDAYRWYNKEIYNLSQLKTINISKDATSVNYQAFLGHSRLKKVTYDGDTNASDGIHLPNSVELIGEYAFAFASVIPSAVIPDSVTSLGHHAFANDLGMTYAVLPSGIDSIPDYCFNNDSQLAAVSDISEIKSIGDYAFNNCSSLSKIRHANGTESDLEFGSDLTTLGKYAFAGTAIDDSIDLGGTKIVSLQEHTFDNCSGLTNVECPDTLAGIKDYAFGQCRNLRKITLPVYAALSKKIFGEHGSGIEIKATLGRYTGTTYNVPIGETTALPAMAFSGCQNEKYYQVYPKGGQDRVELSQANPQYFSLEHNISKNEYKITGLIGVEDAECIVSASLLFEGVTDPVPISITYDVEVTSIHAKSVDFNRGSFKLGSVAPPGIIKEENGTLVVFVSSKATQILTLSAEAVADKDKVGELNLGMITDDPVWSSSDAGVIALRNGSVTKKPASDKCTTNARFDIKGPGTAIVKAAFNDGIRDHAYKTIRIEVIEPIKKVNYSLNSLGEGHINPATSTMTVGQYDQLTLHEEYTNDEDKRDYALYSSSNENVVSVDDSGRLYAGSQGTAKITIKLASGYNNSDVTKELNISVVGQSTVVQPQYVDITGASIGEDGKGLCFVGESAEFSAVCRPANATQGVTWSISDPQTAGLQVKNGKAVLTGIKPSQSNIILTATASNGKKGTLSIAVRQKATNLEFREADPAVIIAGYEASGIKVSNNQSQSGGLVRFPATTQDDVTFTSSDPSVVALGSSSSDCVNDSVTLVNTSTTQTNSVYYKGLKKGNAVITAKTKYGKQATLNVKVISDPILSIDFTVDSVGKMVKNPAKLYMPSGQSDKLSVTPTYSYDADKDDFVRIESSDPSCVTADNSGNIRAVSPGEAVIKIGAASKKISRSITITVKSNKDAVLPVCLETITGPVTEDNKGIVYKGEKATFKVGCLPSYASQNVSWDIGGSSAVSLDSTSGNAVLTGKSANMSLMLRASANCIGGNKSVTKTVITRERPEGLVFIEEPPYIEKDVVKSMTLSSNPHQTSGIIRVPETSMEDVTFTSSDSSVLLVGDSKDDCSKDEVTLTGATKTLYYKGLKEGSATLTAATPDGKTASITVTVIEDPITALEFSESSIKLTKGNKKTAVVNKTPATSTEKVSYESSNTTVAVVDDKGMVTAVGPGTSTITVRSKIRKIAATCIVTVQNDGQSSGSSGSNGDSGNNGSGGGNTNRNNSSANVPKTGQTVGVNGVSYQVSIGGNVILSKYNAAGSTLTVPSYVIIAGRAYRVTKIAANAFSGNKRLKKVTIGNHVMTIGSKAFYKCSSLKTLVIGTSVITIESKAFSNCKKLKSINIMTKQLRVVGKRAFWKIKKKARFKCPKGKKKTYKKMLKRSGLPKKVKFK